MRAQCDRFGKTSPTEGMTLDDVPTLPDRCRDIIGEALPDLRTRYGYES